MIYRPSTIAYECESCGRVFFAYPREKRRFCSTACKATHQRGQWQGAQNPRFNGGLCLRRDGRTVITCRDGSTVLYARAVMEAELSRALSPDELVHHKNGDCTDDRPENLALTTRSAHINMHRAELLTARRSKQKAA